VPYLAVKLVLNGFPMADQENTSPTVGVNICREATGGAEPVAEQVKTSGRDQLPWAGLVKTSVALPEKVSEAGLNVAFVPPSNSLVVPPGGDCTFILLGAVVVPSGHTQW
jgi:hypothetical protein